MELNLRKENEVHTSHERLAIIKVTFHIIIAAINSEMYISKFPKCSLGLLFE
jgi:hypothetical protein